MQFVSHLVILTNELGKIGWILLRGLALIMNYLQIREISIDSKLSIALQNMVENAGEVASEVKIRIRQRSPELGKKGNLLQ